MHVVATAGHVDHGKSTLVQALTGQEPDRLEEERRRGLSIQLGYCWTTLPGVGELAFVDVPGHERFITTTLAGLGPVSAAMLVVAADDPWMPQAAEHLAALDLLQVRHGLLVVTRSDLADPEPALGRARAELSGTSLEAAPAVTVSARTGEGLDALRSELSALVRRLPAPDRDTDARLWVDRRFHVRGIGTVVTGTLPAGTIEVGEALQHEHGSARVRGIEVLGQPVTTVHGTARVALALSGQGVERIDRGAVLVPPGGFELADVLDVRLVGEGRPPERPVLHVGTTSMQVHARPLAEGFHRLVLGHRLPLRMGDRALLRDPGSRQMWGVEVVDPAPPALGRRGAAVVRARALVAADGTVTTELGRRGLVDLRRLRRWGATGAVPDEAVQAGPWLVSAGRATTLRAEIVEFVERTVTPHRPGVTAARVAQQLELPDERLVAALLRPPLRLEHGMVEHDEMSLPPRLQRTVETLRADLTPAPFRAPDADRLRELGVSRADLGALVGAGHLLRVAEGIVLLPGADHEATRRLAELVQPFTVSQARAHLGTSRRVALPLLDLLDRTARTVRLPDDRRRVRG